MSFLALLHALTALLLAVYGANTLILTLLYLRQRRRVLPPPPTPAHWPDVTIQAPIFNELHVADRLIEALAALDYPRARLHIQLLDDSTDETAALVQASAERSRSQGLDVAVLHRSVRPGFKAGALAAAMPQVQSDLIAIFDADFVPAPDFLRRTVPHLLANPQIGFLQTRWAHLNARYSPLTQAQALALDGHFVVEQTVRQRMGWFFGFNGTAGVWRRQCIEDAGGWQADTLCEDLDLSYRAQLRGWQGLYLPDVSAPAEIPPQLAAFKRQQSRWATGSIQVFRKLAGPVARSERPWSHKIEGLIHLGAYFCHPLMVLLLLLTLPMLLLDTTAAAPLRGLLTYLSVVSVGPPLLYAVSQWELYRGQGWLRRLAALPLLVLIGTGLAASNTAAVLRGLSNQPVDFQRTPKFRVQDRRDAWEQTRYTLPLNGMLLAELALMLYALATLYVAWTGGHYYVAPFMLQYAAGFATMIVVSLRQNWQRQAAPRRKLRPAAQTPLAR